MLSDNMVEILTDLHCFVNEYTTFLTFFYLYMEWIIVILLRVLDL